jgi:hypothetical protein
MAGLSNPAILLTAWEASAINLPFVVSLKQGVTIKQHLRDNQKPSYADFERVGRPWLLTRRTANGVTALGRSQGTISGVP